MASIDPTLPSGGSAGHGSYLRISCRQWRRRTTAEDDPGHFVRHCDARGGTAKFRGSLTKGAPTPVPLSNTPGGLAPCAYGEDRPNTPGPKRLPSEFGYEVAKPAGVNAIPGHSVAQGRG